MLQLEFNMDAQFNIYRFLVGTLHVLGDIINLSPPACMLLIFYFLPANMVCGLVSWANVWRPIYFAQILQVMSPRTITSRTPPSSRF